MDLCFYGVVVVVVIAAAAVATADGYILRSIAFSKINKTK